MKATKYLLAVLAAFMFSTAQAQEAAPKPTVLDFFYPLPTQGDSLEYTYQYKNTAKDADVEGYDLHITARKIGDKYSWETFREIRDCCTGVIGTEKAFYRYDKGSKGILLTKLIKTKRAKSAGGKPKLGKSQESNPNKVVLMMPALVQVFDVKEAVFTTETNYERSFIKGGQLIYRDTTDNTASVPTQFVSVGDAKESPYDTLINQQLMPLLKGYDVKEFSRSPLPPKYSDCIKIKTKTYNKEIQTSYYAQGLGLVKNSFSEFKAKKP
jgi:hypothetical protein